MQGPCPQQCVNGGEIMYRRGGVKMYHGLRRELVRVVHGRDPRAGRRALRAAGGGLRVGGTCGPTGSSGGLFGRLPASGSALLEPVALAVHLQDMDVVGDTVEQRAGEALAGEHRGPFLEGQV